ncbi:hypothetical protein WT82_29965 [Burkholderia stagnalis]|nr:hypothetical protein WT82_29965 [Burkholderia stagnalis]
MLVGRCFRYLARLIDVLLLLVAVMLHLHILPDVDVATQLVFRESHRVRSSRLHNDMLVGDVDDLSLDDNIATETRRFGDSEPGGQPPDLLRGGGRTQNSLSATFCRAASFSCISLMPFMPCWIQLVAISRWESDSLSVGVFVDSSELTLVFDPLPESLLDMLIIPFRFQYVDIFESLQLYRICPVADVDHVEQQILTKEIVQLLERLRQVSDDVRNRRNA